MGRTQRHSFRLWPCTANDRLSWISLAPPSSSPAMSYVSRQDLPLLRPYLNLPHPPIRQDSNLLEQQEKELVLNSFTSATAWDLGSTLRSYIQEKYPGNPVVVSVFAGSTEQLYFFATCGEVGPFTLPPLPRPDRPCSYLTRLLWSVLGIVLV
jgi:hypothetical protein